MINLTVSGGQGSPPPHEGETPSKFGRPSNGGTEAINGLIELHRHVARAFRNRDNYRLRMLLIGGGLTSPHLK